MAANAISGASRHKRLRANRSPKRRISSMWLADADPAFAPICSKIVNSSGLLPRGKNVSSSFNVISWVISCAETVMREMPFGSPLQSVHGFASLCAGKGAAAADGAVSEKVRDVKL